MLNCTCLCKTLVVTSNKNRQSLKWTRKYRVRGGTCSSKLPQPGVRASAAKAFPRPLKPLMAFGRLDQGTGWCLGHFGVFVWKKKTKTNKKWPNQSKRFLSAYYEEMGLSGHVVIKLRFFVSLFWKRPWLSDLTIKAFEPWPQNKL